MRQIKTIQFALCKSLAFLHLYGSILWDLLHRSVRHNLIFTVYQLCYLNRVLLTDILPGLKLINKVRQSRTTDRSKPHITYAWYLKIVST